MHYTVSSTSNKSDIDPSLSIDIYPDNRADIVGYRKLSLMRNIKMFIETCTDAHPQAGTVAPNTSAEERSKGTRRADLARGIPAFRPFQLA